LCRDPEERRARLLEQRHDKRGRAEQDDREQQAAPARERALAHGLSDEHDGDAEQLQQQQ
jgi:hypothetical protein